MIKYSEITEMSTLSCYNCDGERMYLCPSCGSDLCIFCMNDCADCGREIDFSV